MIKYRMAIKAGNKTVQICSGDVSDKGEITLAIPKDATPNGVIIIEWEPSDWVRKADANA